MEQNCLKLGWRITLSKVDNVLREQLSLINLDHYIIAELKLKNSPHHMPPSSGQIYHSIASIRV
jgi:hypothetical protein